MKDDLEKYQQLLKAANAKLTKAEETTARLTSLQLVSQYSAQYKRKQKRKWQIK